MPDLSDVQSLAALRDLPPDKPVLIAGPTGSGKSQLALAIARSKGGQVINADALQVYENWRILTARPSMEDEDNIPHALYGHVARDVVYSTGQWLRDVAPLLQGPLRPIIVGGTGLNFAALTEGLAEIPETPPAIREEADMQNPRKLLDALDPETRARIDTANPARVRRAWEVWRNTGRGLAAWQADTPPPLLPAEDAVCLVIDAPKEVLTPRLDARFDTMLAQGAIEEARANLPGWQPTLPSSRAIGASELIAHLRGDMTLDAARTAAQIATRQYAKRQRTWFRARMSGWISLPMT